MSRTMILLVSVVFFITDHVHASCGSSGLDRLHSSRKITPKVHAHGEVVNHVITSMKERDRTEIIYAAVDRLTPRGQTIVVPTIQELGLRSMLLRDVVRSLYVAKFRLENRKSRAEDAHVARLAQVRRRVNKNLLERCLFCPLTPKKA